jgi:predicted transposase YbfD/YdcC
MWSVLGLREHRLILAQMKVGQKSNEITAIPTLLELLEVSGCIITIDAMGCQKSIAALIIDKQADFMC